MLDTIIDTDFFGYIPREMERMAIVCRIDIVGLAS